MGQIFSTPGNPMDEQLYTGTHEIFTCQVQVITAVCTLQMPGTTIMTYTNNSNSMFFSNYLFYLCNKLQLVITFYSIQQPYNTCILTARVMHSILGPHSREKELTEGKDNSCMRSPLFPILFFTPPISFPNILEYNHSNHTVLL